MSTWVLPPVAERVDAGEAAMDADNPGWWRADAERSVDLERLDLADDYDCILGQACPVGIGDRDHSPYVNYAARLAGVPEWDSTDGWAIMHGFMVPRFSDDKASEYAALAAEWCKRISSRRNSA